jgi:hypothetical protein
MTSDADIVLGIRPALIDMALLTELRHARLIEALRKIEGVTVERNDTPIGAENGSWRESITGGGYRLQISGSTTDSRHPIVVTGDCPQWRVSAVRYFRTVALSQAYVSERSLAFAMVAHLRSSIHPEFRAAASAAYDVITSRDWQYA